MSKYVIKEVILRQGRAMKSRGEKYQVRERVKVKRSIFQVRRNVLKARLHIGILKARHNYLTYLLGLAFRGRNMKRNVLKAHRFTYFIGGGGPGRQWGATIFLAPPEGQAASHLGFILSIVTKMI